MKKYAQETICIQGGYEPKNGEPMYMDADPDLQSIQDKIAIQKEKVDFVDSIIKSLTNRGFQLKSAVDFMKFQHGVN